MKFSKMSKEDLELMSYTDITNLILEEKNKQTTKDLFKQIVDILELGKKAFENKIGSYYTSLTTDKRFILLEDGTWDLKKNHAIGSLIKNEDLDDLEDLETDELPDDTETVEDDKDDMFRDVNDEEVDVAEEYKNLVIVNEEDLDLEQ